ncbi:MAG TPA: hypothetical protein VGG48_15835 [Rhizomicrobium sp.]|jgi:hypothetical protein
MIATVVLAASVIFATPLAPPGNEADAAKAYADARRAVDLHSDGFFLDATPEGHDALERRWVTGADWVSAVLNAHPELDAGELATMLLNGDSKLQAEPLDADSWLVGMGDGGFGSFAVVKRIDGRFRPVWQAWHDGAESARFPSLAPWAIDAARKECRDVETSHCGPIYGRTFLLPADASGHARFYVEATYTKDAGGTLGGQTSIWSWDGETATPLLVSDYSVALDQTLGTHFDGAVLRIRQKQDFKTFFACDSCAGRQVEQAVKIAPDGLHDLGHYSVTPELDVIDAAFDRLHRGQPIEGLASPQAVKAMESILRDTSEPGENARNFTLGMLTSSGLRKAGADTELCFQADTTGAFIFTLKYQAGGPQTERLVIVRVRPDPGQNGMHCKGFRE